MTQHSSNKTITQTKNIRENPHLSAKIRGFSLLILSFFLAMSAFAQSDSRYDAGLNLPFNEKAGDVNPQTGNLTLSATDVSLPGRGGLNFSFGRIWALNQSNVFNMYQDPIDGFNKLNSEVVEKYNRLGAGWSGSLPYIASDTSSGYTSINLFFGGSVYSLNVTGLDTNDPLKSNIEGYDLTDMRVWRSQGISYGDGDPVQYSLSNLTSTYGVADVAGTRSTFVLQMKDNSKFWFRQDGRIMMEEDKTGLNRIWYFYNAASQLRVVVDTIGRIIRFTHDSNGNLTNIVWDVIEWVKDTNGQRHKQTNIRQVQFRYDDGETYPAIDNIKNAVVGYRKPYVLKEVEDSYGNVTRYDYTTGTARFTYASELGYRDNVFLMISNITQCYTTGGYKAKRSFEYEVPPKGKYQKKFYNGFMEYYKVSREYNTNRHGREMKDTHYRYYDNGEAGNMNQYSAVVEQGNVKTTYIYSIGTERSKENVLDTLSVETKDGFTQLTDYVYNTDRTKSLEEVYRKGKFAWREKFQYDNKGNLKRYEDKLGLVTSTEYDNTFSIPVREVKTLDVSGTSTDYETRREINSFGQVTKEIAYVTQGGTKRPITVSEITYDNTYGNPISKKDAAGKITYTDYDGLYHAFPYKVRQSVEIATYSSWFSDDQTGTTQIEACGYTLYNSNGSPWIEVDKEGYSVEHFYDSLGTEIETVKPDGDDLPTLPAIIDASQGNPNEANVSAFCATRLNNPGARIVIDYQDEFVKSYTDIDKSANQVKVTGVKKDGLGNVEEEIEYGAGETEYSVKKMTYDTLGRMVGLTDPDAGSAFSLVTVNGTDVEKHDKTWLIKYYDLGRKVKVAYPQTTVGITPNKLMSYDDAQNTVTTIDPEGRKVTERRDWNGNLVQVTAFGDSTTSASEAQVYTYEYDKLNRKIKFTDPKAIITTYKYDERNLLLEEVYSATPTANEGTGKDVMTYNDLGQLEKKTDPKGQIITFTYDWLGRNTSVIHYKSAADYPGTIDHRVDTIYDNRGNAVRISNKDLIEHYIYDHSNRVTTLERRLKMQTIRQSVATVWGGNESTQTFGFTYTYNDAGMVKTMTYPDGSVHRFAYDPTLGRLETIEEKGSGDPSYNAFVTNFDYTTSGVVTKMEYANNTRQEWQFDNRKRISHIKVVKTAEPSNIVIEDLAYKINGSGDILNINDNEYKYDGFDRIVGAKTQMPGVDDKVKLVGKYFGTYQGGGTINGESYNPIADLDADGRVNGKDHMLASLIDENSVYDMESFEYDSNGNRTKLTQNGDQFRYEYEAGSRNRLAKVWKTKKDAFAEKIFAEYTYDANGNTTRRIIHPDTGAAKTIDFEYDTMNRLVKTTERLAAGDKVSEYFYDNAGNRFIKKDADGTTVYLRHGQIAVAMDIEVNAVQTPDKGKINRYVLSGDLLAGRVTTIVHETGNPTIAKSWYHLDHLNSTKVVTDINGVVDVRYVYRAFGEQLKRLDASGTDTTDKAKYSYGGKELDDETNLYYFNARYYDATTGRFINVDPVQDGTNWYVYCNNNPLNAKDPTGLDFGIVNQAVITPGGLSLEVGHSAMWVGSEKSGYDFYSYELQTEKNKEYMIKSTKMNGIWGMLGDAGVLYHHFETKKEVDKYLDSVENGATYNRRAEMKTSENTDQKMRQTAGMVANENVPWDLFEPNCADYVRTVVNLGLNKELLKDKLTPNEVFDDFTKAKNVQVTQDDRIERKEINKEWAKHAGEGGYAPRK